MSAAMVARPTSLRDIPWLVWLPLVLVGGLFISARTSPGSGPIQALATPAPVVFAAAVIYAKPSDRRFVWAALGLAATPAVGLLVRLIPDLVFSYAPGDWKNAALVLRDIG